MRANPKQQPAQSPSIDAVTTASKYTNKDGSKFITIPKFSSSTDSSETSPNMAQATAKANAEAINSSPADQATAPTVNKKKQKRRQKLAEQAAKIAAEASIRAGGIDGLANVGDAQSRLSPGYQGDQAFGNTTSDRVYYSDDEGDGYSGSYEHSVSPPHSLSPPPTNMTAKPGKRKGKGKSAQSDQTALASSSTATAATPQTIGMSKEKIWNTSSQEERERIKVFWLSLGEEERRSLVKVEKDAVLKKMKEQQKHSCSCTVCGRKRIAIEEELEVLYDAYYEELEQYANNQHGDRPPPMMPGSQRFGALSGLQPPNRLPPAFSGRQPSRGRIVEQFGDEEEEEEGDEEYSEDEAEEEDYISDEEPPEEIARSHATDFFNFGQSLTVQGNIYICVDYSTVLMQLLGGILTVADDLLKNDGKKFIEMMEQLAERRMAREEDAKEHYTPNGYPHPNGMQTHTHHSHHNHPPAPEEDEDYDDEEEEDEYDSQDGEYDEEEMVPSHTDDALITANPAQDAMTEEQRMEEGRRMFQIFAARMFEQRVLTAYKEKVAAERQEKLLQELDEEDMAIMQKKAKKAKEAQKKKEKAAQKKLVLAEEKARRDAEKAAEEAARLAEEAAKAEEARLRAEEKRRKREAQKKAEDEERLRKEAEKQRRVQEQRERQAEQERKARETKEREKREKEELRQKEKEAKEAKEKELREKKEKQEKEKKDAELKAKADKEAGDSRRREEAAQQQGKRQQQPISIPTPGGHQSWQTPSNPHIPVVTPAIPKAPTPNRPVNPPQREPAVPIPHTPRFGSSGSQSTSPNSSTPLQNSPGPQALPSRTPSQPFLHHPQANAPMHSTLKGPQTGFGPPPFPGMQPPMGMGGFQPGLPQMAPGFGGRMHQEPMFPHQSFGNQFRPMSGHNAGPMYPGMNNMPMPQGRGLPGPHAPPPGFMSQMSNGMGPLSQPFGGHKEPGPSQLHSRQQSGSFDKPLSDSNAPPASGQPIARPAPIGRPGSVVQGQRSDADIDDLAGHLGSSALLDDSDEPIAINTRRSSAAPGSLSRQGGFGQSGPYSMDPSAFSSPGSYGTWGGPPNPFGSGSLPGSSFMGGWGNSAPSGFGNVSGLPARPSQPRSVAVRLMLCRACKILEGSTPDGFFPINAVREQINRINTTRDDTVSDKELLDLCETEGNPNNGGGFFDVRNERDGRVLIRHEPDSGGGSHRPVGAPGDIGSPITTSANATPSNRFSSGMSGPGSGF